MERRDHPRTESWSADDLLLLALAGGALLTGLLVVVAV